MNRSSLVIPVALAVLAFAAGLSMSGLVGGSDEGHRSDSVGAPADDARYTCAMHPQVVSDTPGSCPLCGMDLVPVSSATALGPAQVALSERARRLARVETVAVHATSSSSMPISLLGRVDYDETRRKTVTAWVSGRIDRLNVSVTGQRLRPGQRIATLYSPEIYAAHSDLLQAARQLRSLERGSELARKAAQASLRSVRERLRLLGVPDAELSRMETADTPWQQVPIRSPFGGTVIERLVDEGMYVKAGTGLYRLAELSKLWVQLDAYESDLPHIGVGDKVTLTVEALPGQTFEGTVSFIDPTLDARTRTTRVRVEVANRDRLLRPGMFAQATVATRRGSTGGDNGDDEPEPVLTIPDTAPLFTGRRSLVFVEVRGDADGLTVYEAREVELGPRTGRVYPVVAGLRAGERVVARGAFALDADLQIRGGDSMMARADDVERTMAEPAVAAVDDLPNDLRTRLAAVVERYLEVQRALAGDDLDKARRAARDTTAATDAVGDALTEDLRERWERMGPRLRAAAATIADSTDLAGARRAFETASAQLAALLATFGNPGKAPVERAYCPMAFGSRGASWFQAGDIVDNPYEGLAMRTCGSVIESVPAGQFLGDAAMAPLGAGSGGPGAAGGHVH